MMYLTVVTIEKHAEGPACDLYDALKTGHKHCQHPVPESDDFAAPTVCCDEVLPIEKEGFGLDEWAILKEFGALCSVCKLPTCKAHLTDHTPDGSLMCRDCASDACRAAQDKDELFMTLHRATSDVDAFVERLGEEVDPERIRAAVKDLHRFNAAVDRAHLAMMTRCSDLQMRGAA